MIIPRVTGRARIGGFINGRTRLTRRALLTSTTVPRTRFTRVTAGAFGTSGITFFTSLTSITRRHSTAIGERIFQTLLARFRSGQVLEITRVAIQTIDRTFFVHVLASTAFYTRFVARIFLMVSFQTFLAHGFFGHSFFVGILPSRTSIATHCTGDTSSR